MAFRTTSACFASKHSSYGSCGFILIAPVQSKIQFTGPLQAMVIFLSSLLMRYNLMLLRPMLVIRKRYGDLNRLAGLKHEKLISWDKPKSSFVKLNVDGSAKGQPGVTAPRGVISDEDGNDTTYFGAIVGRVANRIKGAEFTINGVSYKLVANEGKNTLHGGSKGFADVIWHVRNYKQDSHVTFTYYSFDGEQGFPGNLQVSVTYMIIGTNKLGVKMEAKPLNKATPVNLALHTYWNLGGHSSGDILSHTLQLFGSSITPVDDELIPTGKIDPVQGTPYDFLQPHEIGSMLDQLPHGYDVNYVLDKSSPQHLRKVAVVHESKSGRKMELWTNKPGVQVYTSNMLKSEKGKDGFVYSTYAGLCLETQGFPDSVNHPNFPSQIVNPGETCKHFMVFRFTTN
ncbi:Galactose mutarotase-like superfamily protein [Theobroma cacao]|uniref:Galactose mutarotase-like superfamily protein n=1 Tax=Theobroma cacao TaxID=3641 RepID=A0A061FWZ0_THECC|nr:Galactose mutarotase-like superfamily protein [Theobroma cacao]